MISEANEAADRARQEPAEFARNFFSEGGVVIPHDRFTLWRHWRKVAVALVVVLAVVLAAVSLMGGHVAHH